MVASMLRETARTEDWWGIAVRRELVAVSKRRIVGFGVVGLLADDGTGLGWRFVPSAR